MRRRSKHRVRAVVVLTAAASLMCTFLWATACGSDEEATTTETSQGPSTTTSTSLPAAESLVGKTLEISEETPQEFAQAYGTQPLVVFFYVPGNADDGSVLETVQGLEREFPAYVFLKYDYKLPVRYGDLATKLKVGYPPQLVLIDRKGVIREVWNGYIDEGSLNQKLVDLGRG